MGDITLLLEGIRSGHRDAAELVAAVYDELRTLARSALFRERRGQSLEATDLVHEAYFRLLGGGEVPWQNRAHFFASAAEAMRRILIDRARRRLRLKRGGGAHQVEFGDDVVIEEAPAEEILAVDEALSRLERIDPDMGQVVKLRYFAGCSVPETAEIMGLSSRTVDRLWVSARAWLQRELVSEAWKGS